MASEMDVRSSSSSESTSTVSLKGDSDIAFPTTLTLQIPADSAYSSVQSSTTSSPIGPLESSATTTPPTPVTPANSSAGSCTSLPLPMRDIPRLNVKFAPLPQLAPRKRRSTAPMGMAARAQLVNRSRRRQQQPQHYSHYDPEPGPRYNAHETPAWTDKDLAEAQLRQVSAAVERERQRREGKGNGTVEGDEDPFMVFGRVLKGAGKTLWKKVGKKDKTGKKADSTDTPEQTGKAPKGKKEKRKAKRSAVVTGVVDQPLEPTGASTPRSPTTLNGSFLPTSPTKDSASQDTTTAAVADYQIGDLPLDSQGDQTPKRNFTEESAFGEGRVWEESVDQDFLRSIGQTETIIEGRTKYAKTSTANSSLDTVNKVSREDAGSSAETGSSNDSRTDVAPAAEEATAPPERTLPIHPTSFSSTPASS